MGEWRESRLGRAARRYLQLRQSRSLLHPLKTVRQWVLLAVVCLGLDVLGAVTLPWAWSRTAFNMLSLLVAFTVVEVVYRRWWQPADQPEPTGAD